MMHPDTALRFISDPLGLGVVATRLIPKGTITWVLDPLDQRFSPGALAALPAALREAIGPWCFVLSQQHVLCWDHGRYCNHSCDPSCSGVGWDFEIALRDIHPGEQLTDDYACLQAEASFVCQCGAPGCRKTIRAADRERYGASWEADVREATPLMTGVPQPLWSLLSAADQEAIRRSSLPTRSHL